MTKWTMVAGDFVTTGGMDCGNYALAWFLARSGDAVELVAHRVAPSLAALPGITVRSVRRPLGSHALGSWPLSSAGLRSARATCAGGGRVLVNGGNCLFPDVNWVHYVHAAYRPEIPASWLRQCKSRIERPRALRAERLAVRAARVVVCNSERTRRDVIEKLGADSDRVTVVYYGIDSIRFQPAIPAERGELRIRLGWPSDRPVLMFVGALGDRRKGFDVLFDAWVRSATDRNWDTILMVVGRGAELPRWESRVALAGLTDRIRFLGFRTDVDAMLRAADGFVAPARYEAYGLGVHEALCCGLPAIVSAESGVSERYPPDLADLILLDPEDAGELADRLKHWRANLDSFALRIRPVADELRSYTFADMARDIRATALRN